MGNSAKRDARKMKALDRQDAWQKQYDAIFVKRGR